MAPRTDSPTAESPRPRQPARTAPRRAAPLRPAGRQALAGSHACLALATGLFLWLAVDRGLAEAVVPAALAGTGAALTLAAMASSHRQLRRNVVGPIAQVVATIEACAVDRRAGRCGPQRTADLQQLATSVDSMLEQIDRVESGSASILEAARDAVVTINHRGVIQTFNPAAEQMFGYPAGAIIGHNVARLMPEVHARRHDGYISRYLETGVAKVLGFPREEIGLRADGSTFPISLYIARVDDGSEQPRFCGIVRDITEQQQVEREVLLHAMQIEQTNVQLAQAKFEAEDARAQAETANRSKSEFLANMSHEIRTPMTAILGFTENLLSERLDAAERQQSLETIRRNGEHLMALINDILDLSKIEAGRLDVERMRFSPAALVADVASSMRVRADGKGLGLRIEFDGPIPATVESDPTRLRQILINLCGNAIKFTEEGGVTIRVGTETTAHGTLLAFAIADTGIGLSADQVKRLFRPFEQADSSTTRRFGGTGLGLNISKRLVERLGGTIEVESRPGAGSTFHFTIDPGLLHSVPMLTDVQEALQTRLTTSAALPTKAPMARLHGRILLAEDGPDNQRLIRFLLEKAGAEVAVVGDGRAAVEQVLDAESAGRPFDLVLMDMQMPVQDGYEATGELRQRGYDRPIVALTANAMAGDRERCLRAGCTEFAPKPVDRRALLALLATMLPPAPAADDPGPPRP
ncbi:MAG: ATP-binding protein [Planctomycetota bacterium]